jgi:twitching motility protein PilT
MDIDKLFQLAVKNKASDLHLVNGLSPLLRINGEIIPISKLKEAKDYFKEEKVSNTDLEKLLTEILTAADKEKFLLAKDLDFGYSLDDVRFRVNLSYEKGSIHLVARVINSQEVSLEELGMPAVTKKILRQNQGLVLVTGPTGSGKSTTLAAMINYINSTEACNIITLEDPIEFLFQSKKSIITQRQLGSDMNSFASGLKHVLRQDPDIIMVGEMRDLETISAAITLAETGHLVLATLHTCSAAQTIDRIIDIFPPHQQNQIKSQLSSILLAVISQRLLPKVGGGRVAAREVLIHDSAVANLIREQKIPQINNVIETSANEGMITMSKSIKELYKNELISEEVAEEELEKLELF